MSMIMSYENLLIVEGWLIWIWWKLVFDDLRELWRIEFYEIKKKEMLFELNVTGVN